MKTRILKSVSALVLALALVGPAAAQNWRLTADIPFNFNVGETNVPGGKYTVEIISMGVLRLRSNEHQTTINTLSNAMYSPSELRKGKLVFNVYGDRYFLSSVSWPYNGPSRILLTTDVELRIAKDFQVKRKLDVASQ